MPDGENGHDGWPMERRGRLLLAGCRYRWREERVRLWWEEVRLRIGFRLRIKDYIEWVIGYG